MFLKTLARYSISDFLPHYLSVILLITYIFGFIFFNCTALPCGPGEEKIRRECDLSVARVFFCEECGKSLNTSGNMKSHIVRSQMFQKCKVCGRRPYFSRHVQAHKKNHHNIVVSIYLPTLAVHIWHIGTEVFMCIQSVVHIIVV